MYMILKAILTSLGSIAIGLKMATLIAFAIQDIYRLTSLSPIVSYKSFDPNNRAKNCICLG